MDRIWRIIWVDSPVADRTQDDDFGGVMLFLRNRNASLSHIVHTIAVDAWRTVAVRGSPLIQVAEKLELFR